MEQLTEFFHCGGIDKLGAVDEVSDMGKIILLCVLRRDKAGTDLIGGIGCGGDIHLVIGNDPQPNGRTGKEL